ncbi:hypothetical protein BDZ89DRAFT_1111281 [Hymenopellis radicata]|nr:hypothetical protein BDZ89DRAFT_1111281 [Hymenopellis radicata]
MARSTYADDLPPRYISSQPVYFTNLVDHSAEATARRQHYIYDAGRLGIHNQLDPYPDIEPANLTHPSRDSDWHWNGITGQPQYHGWARHPTNAQTVQIPRHGRFDVPDGSDDVCSTGLPVAHSQSFSDGNAPSMLPPAVADTRQLAETLAMGAVDNPAGRITGPASPFVSSVAPWAQSYDQPYTGSQPIMNSTFNAVHDRIRNSQQPPIPSGLMPLFPTEVLSDHPIGGYASVPFSNIASGSSSSALPGANVDLSDAPHTERDVVNLRRRGREQKVIVERRKHPATYICPECSADFTTNSARNKHVQSKHEFHVFPCEKCAKQYADYSSLGRHMRTKHNV